MKRATPIVLALVLVVLIVWAAPGAWLTTGIWRALGNLIVLTILVWAAGSLVLWVLASDTLGPGRRGDREQRP